MSFDGYSAESETYSPGTKGTDPTAGRPATYVSSHGEAWLQVPISPLARRIVAISEAARVVDDANRVVREAHSALIDAKAASYRADGVNRPAAERAVREAREALSACKADAFAAAQGLADVYCDNRARLRATAWDRLDDLQHATEAAYRALQTALLERGDALFIIGIPKRYMPVMAPRLGELAACVHGINVDELRRELASS